MASDEECVVPVSYHETPSRATSLIRWSNRQQSDSLFTRGNGRSVQMVFEYRGEHVSPWEAIQTALTKIDSDAGNPTTMGSPMRTGHGYRRGQAIVAQGASEYRLHRGAADAQSGPARHGVRRGGL